MYLFLIVIASIMLFDAIRIKYIRWQLNVATKTLHVMSASVNNFKSWLETQYVNGAPVKCSIRKQHVPLYMKPSQYFIKIAMKAEVSK